MDNVINAQPIYENQAAILEQMDRDKLEGIVIKTWIQSLTDKAKAEGIEDLSTIAISFDNDGTLLPHGWGKELSELAELMLHSNIGFFKKAVPLLKEAGFSPIIASNQWKDDAGVPVAGAKAVGSAANKINLTKIYSQDINELGGPLEGLLMVGREVTHNGVAPDQSKGSAVVNAMPKVKHVVIVDDTNKEKGHYNNIKTLDSLLGSAEGEENSAVMPFWEWNDNEKIKRIRDQGKKYGFCAETLTMSFLKKGTSISQEDLSEILRINKVATIEELGEKMADLLEIQAPTPDQYKAFKEKNNFAEISIPQEDIYINNERALALARQQEAATLANDAEPDTISRPASSAATPTTSGSQSQKSVTPIANEPITESSQDALGRSRRASLLKKLGEALVTRRGEVVGDDVVSFSVNQATPKEAAEAVLEVFASDKAQESRDDLIGVVSQFNQEQDLHKLAFDSRDDRLTTALKEMNIPKSKTNYDCKEFVDAALNEYASKKAEALKKSEAPIKGFKAFWNFISGGRVRKQNRAAGQEIENAAKEVLAGDMQRLADSDMHDFSYLSETQDANGLVKDSVIIRLNSELGDIPLVEVLKAKSGNGQVGVVVSGDGRVRREAWTTSDLGDESVVDGNDSPSLSEAPFALEKPIQPANVLEGKLFDEELKDKLLGFCGGRNPPVGSLTIDGVLQVFTLNQNQDMIPDFYAIGFGQDGSITFYNERLESINHEKAPSLLSQLQEVVNGLERVLIPGQLASTTQMARGSLPDDIMAKKFGNTFKAKGSDTVYVKGVSIGEERFVLKLSEGAVTIALEGDVTNSAGGMLSSKDVVKRGENGLLVKSSDGEGYLVGSKYSALSDERLEALTKFAATKSARSPSPTPHALAAQELGGAEVAMGASVVETHAAQQDLRRSSSQESLGGVSQ